MALGVALGIWWELGCRERLRAGPRDEAFGLGCMSEFYRCCRELDIFQLFGTYHHESVTLMQKSCLQTFY